MAIGHVAVAVGDAFHQIRRVQIPAVDAGRLRRDQRQRRHGEVLAEGVAGQIQLGKAAVRGEHAHGLAAQIDARGVHQSEGPHILVEFLAADPQSIVDERRVAGVPHRLHQRL